MSEAGVAHHEAESLHSARQGGIEPPQSSKTLGEMSSPSGLLFDCQAPGLYIYQTNLQEHAGPIPLTLTFLVLERGRRILDSFFVLLSFAYSLVSLAFMLS